MGAANTVLAAVVIVTEIWGAGHGAGCCPLGSVVLTQLPTRAWFAFRNAHVLMHRPGVHKGSTAM